MYVVYALDVLGCQYDVCSFVLRIPDASKTVLIACRLEAASSSAKGDLPRQRMGQDVLCVGKQDRRLNEKVQKLRISTRELAQKRYH